MKIQETFQPEIRVATFSDAEWQLCRQAVGERAIQTMTQWSNLAADGDKRRAAANLTNALHLGHAFALQDKIGEGSSRSLSFNYHNWQLLMDSVVGYTVVTDLMERYDADPDGRWGQRFNQHQYDELAKGRYPTDEAWAFVDAGEALWPAPSQMNS